MELETEEVSEKCLKAKDDSYPEPSLFDVIYFAMFISIYILHTCYLCQC